MRGWITCDGDALLMPVILSEEVIGKFSEVLWDLMRLPAGCSGIYQADDVGNRFIGMKATLNTTIEKQPYIVLTKARHDEPKLLCRRAKRSLIWQLHHV